MGTTVEISCFSEYHYHDEQGESFRFHLEERKSENSEYQNLQLEHFLHHTRLEMEKPEDDWLHIVQLP